jgi:hypothetical protein
MRQVFHKAFCFQCTAHGLFSKYRCLYKDFGEQAVQMSVQRFTVLAVQ